MRLNPPDLENLGTKLIPAILTKASGSNLNLRTKIQYFANHEDSKTAKPSPSESSARASWSDCESKK